MTATPVWDGWAKIDALLVAAAAAMADPISLVRRGLPGSVPTDMIRYWYDGNTDSPFGPDTLTQSQEGLSLTIGVFLPMRSALSAGAEAALDERLENADNCIQGALLGDAHLGTAGAGSAIGVRIEDSSASVELVGGGPVRVLLVPVTYGLSDRHTITP